MHRVVKGGDQVQVQVHVKAAVNDHVHDDDHVDVNGRPNFPTRCS
jgi:hypothetical protein